MTEVLWAEEAPKTTGALASLHIYTRRLVIILAGTKREEGAERVPCSGDVGQLSSLSLSFSLAREPLTWPARIEGDALALISPDTESASSRKRKSLPKRGCAHSVAAYTATLSLRSEKLHLAGARPPGFTNDDDDAPLSSRIKFSVFSAPPTSPFFSQSLADILARLPLPAGSL